MTSAVAPEERRRAITTYQPPPPMPSIAASALLETRALIALTRRTLATLLVRG